MRPLGTGPGKLKVGGVSQTTKWPDNVYRRLLVDMHVPDWHPDLLSRFDPVDCIATIARAGFQSYQQYAISCAGLCLWPTKVGRRTRTWAAATISAMYCKSAGVMVSIPFATST